MSSKSGVRVWGDWRMFTPWPLRGDGTRTHPYSKMLVRLLPMEGVCIHTSLSCIFYPLERQRTLRFFCDLLRRCQIVHGRHSDRTVIILRHGSTCDILYAAIGAEQCPAQGIGVWMHVCLIPVSAWSVCSQSSNITYHITPAKHNATEKRRMRTLLATENASLNS